MASSSTSTNVEVDPLFTFAYSSSHPGMRNEESFDAENEDATSNRVRVQTEKGKEYAILRLTDAFQSAKRLWRQQLNRLQSQVITQSEIPALQRDCELLEERMKELFKAQEALEEVVESSAEREELDRNFEELARENNAILR